MEPSQKKFFSNKQEKKELEEAISNIWNQNLSFLNSMAIECAIELGISEAIKSHGKPMTLSELATSLSILPHKTECLQQMMLLLVHCNIFTTHQNSVNANSVDQQQNGDVEEETFDLTLSSQLLVKDHPLSQAPLSIIGQNPLAGVSPSHQLAMWFQDQDPNSSESPFRFAKGMHVYHGMPRNDQINELFNRAMASDSRVISSLLLGSEEFKGLIHDGVESMVDVGGGDGTMAKAIAHACPKVKCTVFDQPHVVNGLQVDDTLTNLTYVAGDMFQAIPSANVVLLKWIFHNWSDEKCIEVLKLCKDAIPSRDKGGKLLIIDIVVGIPSDNENHLKSQYLASMHMSYLFGAKERTEKQWKYLFLKSGFCDYKILPILGCRSIIEVFPA